MSTVNNVQEKSRGRSGKEKIWQAALYVRLSREDGDKEESDSVVNQKDLLQQFVNLEPDIKVELNDEQIKYFNLLADNEDPVKVAAVEYLKGVCNE